MAAQTRKRPNILLLLADDQRFDTIHALGNKHIETPNLDRLVHNGTAFTSAYIMGSMSGAVCIPSRAMLLTGRTLFHLNGQGQVIPPEHVTLPELLRKVGYRTFHTGKWHQTPQSYNRCFDEGAKIFFGGMTDQFKVPVHDYDPSGQYPKEKMYYEQGKHSSELFSDAAIEFIRSHRMDDKPFFMYVCYTSPHDPRRAPDEYHQMYRPQDMELPKNFLPQHPFDNGEMKVRDETLAPWPRTPDEIRRHIAEYYAMITHLDAQLGRVLTALRQTGHADNTIVIFAGDNGLAVGQHGLLGKQNLYEHSVHVPLIFAGPGIPRHRTRNGFCYLLDVYPALCEMLGLPVPASVEGRSLAAVIRDRRERVRDRMFFAYKDVQRAVSDGRFKLIEYCVNGRRTTQLFNLRTDPWEMHNLAGDRDYADCLAELRGRLLAWKDEAGDKSPFWQDRPTG
jgi:arylsulfatase A-like enzyme